MCPDSLSRRAFIVPAAGGIAGNQPVAPAPRGLPELLLAASGEVTPFPGQSTEMTDQFLDQEVWLHPHKS